MNNPTTHPPPGTWNARNLLTVPEVAEWVRVHPKDMLQAVYGSTPESQKAEFQELVDGLST